MQFFMQLICKEILIEHFTSTIIGRIKINKCVVTNLRQLISYKTFYIAPKNLYLLFQFPYCPNLAFKILLIKSNIQFPLFLFLPPNRP